LFALVDVNAMFASCHAAEDPSLRGLPLLVAGDPSDRRSIVLTASYEARAFGVHTAMPIGQALRLCPKATVVAPDRHLYERYSHRLFEALGDFTPDVRPVSIDEAYLDLRGCPGLEEGPLVLAATIRAAVLARVGLQVSIGLSEGPWLAKMAADLAKKLPEGVLLLEPGSAHERLAPLAVEAFHGIGPKTAEKLRALGIATIGDLARADPALLRPFGVHGPRMQRLARGEDRGRLPESAAAVSLSHEETFAHDVRGTAELRPILVHVCDRVADRLRREGLLAGGASLRLRNAAFRDFTRQEPLPAPSARPEDLLAAVDSLLRRMPGTAFPCRLAGVAATHLQPRGGAPELFPDPAAERRDRLWQTVTDLRRRYGPDALRPLGSGRGPSPRRTDSSTRRPRD